jgi:hypothetical protein
VGVLATACGGSSEEVGTQGQALSGDVYSETWDDFKDGFTEVSTHGYSAKWFYFAAGPFVGNDGLIETGPHGLRVVAPGTNPVTGEPAFLSTLAQEDENGGLPGGLDHVKWLAYMFHFASSGYPGFDAVPGREVSCQAPIGGEPTYRRTSFGSAVTNANDDMRLPRSR